MGEIFINYQTITSKKLNALGAEIQENPSIHTLKLTNNIILSDFQDFYMNTKFSSLKHMNLSNSQLTDSQGAAICNLIKDSYLATVVLDNNLFKSTSFKESVLFNQNLEEFSISHNPLCLEVVLNILDLISDSSSLRILGLQGYNNILYDKKLPEVLKNSILIILKYDLYNSDPQVLRSIGKTLLNENRCLVSIETRGIDWESISSKDPLLQIKRALKANLWLSQNDNLPSECGDEIFLDVQDVVEQKQKSQQEKIYEKNKPDIDEEEMIALEYEKIPEIVSNFSEISDIKSADQKSFEKSNINEELSAVMEKFSLKLENSMEKLCEKVEALEKKVENQQDDVKKLKNLITSKFKSITEAIETEVSSLSGKYNQISNKIEEKIIQLENKEDKKSLLLTEITKEFENVKESFKDLEARIDTLELAQKSLKIQDQSAKEQKELEKLSKKISEIQTQFFDLQEKNLAFTSKLSKYELHEENSKKHQAKLDSLFKEFGLYQKTVDSALYNLEERTSEFTEHKSSMTNFQKEMYSKLTNLEVKFIDISNKNKVDEFKQNFSSVEARIEYLEEKISKGLNETAYSFRHRDQLIENRLSYLEQERLNVEELKSKIYQRLENENYRETSRHEKSLNERIANIEKLDKKKSGNKAEGISENRITELSEIFPEEAESLILTSIIDKVNKSKDKDLYTKSFENFRTRKNLYK